MPRVIDNNFMVCTDCLQVIANDDWSGINYHFLDDEEAELRIAEIQAGIENAGGYICAGNADKDESFSTSSCDCCGNHLHGSRHHCVVLSNN